MQWIAGIQTCPRNGLDLSTTLHSIHNGGWNEVLVFGEPGTIIPEGYHGIVWPYQTGDWGGWYAALSFLNATQPNADYYVMFEDDIIMCQNIKNYVEKWIHLCHPLGVVCLYTPPRHHRLFLPQPVVTNEALHGWQLWGSQAVVFSRISLRLFLSSPYVLNFRDSDIGTSNAHKDAVIGIWAESEGLGVFYHTPSMVQHKQLTSIVGNQNHQASDFLGENFDLNSWNKIPLVLNCSADTIPWI